MSTSESTTAQTPGIEQGTLIERIRDGQRGRIHDHRAASPLAEIAWANGSRSVESVTDLRIIAEAPCASCGGAGRFWPDDEPGRECRRCKGAGRVEVA